MTDKPIRMRGVSAYQDRHGRTRWRYQRLGIRAELGRDPPGSPMFEAKLDAVLNGEPMARLKCRLIFRSQPRLPVVIEGEDGEVTALYRYFDRAGTLLYVGISKSAAQRWAKHSGSQWDRLATRIDVTWFSSRKDAAEAEAKAIEAEMPYFNRTFNKKARQARMANGDRITLPVKIKRTKAKPLAAKENA